MRGSVLNARELGETGGIGGRSRRQVFCCKMRVISIAIIAFLILEICQPSASDLGALNWEEFVCQSVWTQGKSRLPNSAL